MAGFGDWLDRMFMGPAAAPSASEANLRAALATAEERVTKLTLERDAARRELDAVRERADDLQQIVDEAVITLTGKEPPGDPRLVPRDTLTPEELGHMGARVVDPTWGGR